jgi:Fe-S-cluster containining protein
VSKNEAAEIRKRRAREKRAARRVGSDGAPARSAAANATFAEVIEAEKLVSKTSHAGRTVIKYCEQDAGHAAKRVLKVISCHTCTAPKGCCKIWTVAYLHEVVPIAARLIRKGRDTPELRAELQESATAMESTRRSDYRGRPCVFLSDTERCTIYEDRPVECGAAFVSSDPELCSSTDPNARIEQYVTPHADMVPPHTEMSFVQEARLRRGDFPYAGALPRMVLLCLQAWHRTDYVEFLRKGCRVANEKYQRAM